MRRGDFKALFKEMNSAAEDNQERDAPHPFMKLSKISLQSYADPYDLAKEVRTHEDGTCEIVKNVDFGSKFDQEIRTYLSSFRTSNKEQENYKIKSVKFR
ncbi:hypothetical protein SK128_008792 [Halocaridina rubra]|uniref:Uncharacterized protein n=1 Tax=Halocaridina rubra TaxID=373956 RepID=A0AAN8WTZ5_HALRR